MPEFESNLQHAAPASRAPEKGVQGIEATYSLTALQRSMLFLHVAEPASGVDIEQVVCKLPVQLDLEAFRNAWEKVVERHAILRTSFSWLDGEPLQHVHRSVAVPFFAADWRGMSAHDQQRRFNEFLESERARGFDMGTAPIFRLNLFRTAEAQYIFAWTFHHILLDGRAFAVVMREVATFYDAHRQGASPLLQPAPAFSEHVSWLAQRDLTESERYWRDVLRGFDTPTPIGLAHASASAVLARRQADREVHLSVESTRAFQRLRAELGTTPTILLQSAWAVLLGRYSGQKDVVFGATRACRRVKAGKDKDVVGLFINTIPVRVRLQEDQSVRDLVRSVQRHWGSVREHEHTPLTRMQAWSDVPTGQSLFNTLVVFENQKLDFTLRSLGAVWAESELRLYERTSFPLTLAAYGGERLCLRIDYDSARLDEATVDRLLGHLGTLLESMAANPDMALRHLQMLAPDELRQLLVDWSGERVDFGPVQAAHRRVETHARLQPASLAVRAGGSECTYEQLNARANRIARYLQRSGVTAGEVVAICLSRSVDSIASMLAVLKAGCAYLPIDPEYPADRIAFMVEDAGAKVVLTLSDLQSRLAQCQARIVQLDTESAAIEQCESADLVAEDRDDSLAYVIYTSGSTGRPKGVPIRHRNLHNLICWHQRAYSVTASDRATVLAGPAFDASVWEIWPYLTAGASLHVPDDSVRADSALLVQWLSDEGVSLAFLPTPLMELALQEQWPAHNRLRVLLTGGDKLHRWPSQSLPFRVVNHYGPTENTVVSTCADITAAPVSDAAPPIGRPLPNTTAYILDDQLRPAPIGVSGELHVGGAQLSAGYWERPELTAEKFIAHPFTDEPGAKLYKTGDLARWRADGQIDFQGRVDAQVKIRGFRIELGEIEAVLCQHAQVRDAVVLACDDSSGAKRLVAYVATGAGDPSLSGALRAELAMKLPDYMLPSAIVALERLPLTPNGKIDRSALPQPQLDGDAGGQPYVAPTTDVEKLLTEIWRTVLRRPRIGVHDNFFDLGGDSILSIQIIGQARHAGWQLAPKMMFQYPTIAELARQAKAIGAKPRGGQAVEGSAPLSPIQRWFFEQRFADTHHWNQAFLFATRQPLDADLLAAALQETGRHHDSLRLRYRSAEQPDSSDEEFQCFAASTSIFPLEVVDIAGLPDAERRRVMQERAAACQSSLDLVAGPLCRAVYFDAGAAPGRLLLVIHHLLVDAVSWRLIMEDLETAYHQLRSGAAVSLPAKTTSFKEWVQRLEQYSMTSAFEAELPYWNRERATAADILWESSAEGCSEGDAAVLVTRLDAQETDDLMRRVPAAYGTQINDILLTALARAFGAVTRRDEIVINLEGHGREDLFDDVDVSRTVGWFTSMFPVRLRLANASCAEWDCGQAIKAVKEQLRGIPQRGLGFGALRYLRRSPTLIQCHEPQVAFNYLGQFDQVLAQSRLYDFAPEACGAWRSPNAHRTRLLDVDCMVMEGRLECRWTYSPSVHSQEQVAQLASEFTEALREVIAHCLTPGVGGYTAADFPDAALSDADLDDVLRQLG